MKALSVQPLYAMCIAFGWKFIELRTWKTNYRGWIMICASQAINKVERETMVNGHAIAIAELSEVRPYNDEDDRELAALFDDETFSGYSWVFNGIVPIKPIPIKGQQRLFNVPYEIEDLEAIELDYESPTLAEDLLDWWYEHGYIKNKDFLAE